MKSEERLQRCGRRKKKTVERFLLVELLEQKNVYDQSK